MRQWLVDYSRGDNLNAFWRLFFWRSRTKRKWLRDAQTLFLSRMAHRHGGYVGIEAAFGGRPRLPHGLHGVYISRFASVGRDCCIYQNVTIGEIGRAAPRIGDRCLIGAGAILVGGITIGSDVKVGAGAVVHTDVPAGSTVVPGAARILKKERGA